MTPGASAAGSFAGRREIACERSPLPVSVVARYAEPVAVRLELAGRVCISSGADHVGEEALGRQGRLALAYLVCERRRPVPRDELAEVVWGEDLPESWEQMLRGIIARLRTCLRSVGVAAKQALTTTLGGYQFHLTAEWVVDVEMAAEAAQAAFAATDPDRAAALAASAIEGASGQFLPGAAGLWV